MATRTLNVALWDYRDRDGQHHRAYFGATIDTDDLSTADAQRAERLEIFAVETEPEPPKRSARKVEWIDYVVAQGMDRDQAEAMTKTALIDAVTAENT